MPFPSLSRRLFMSLLGSAAALSGFRPATAAEGELKVLNWQGYGTDEKWALEIFEKKTGLKVVHDYFNSEQEMLTKLRTSPGTYDVVLMNNIYVMDAVNEGLVQPIDTGKITNFNDLTPALARLRSLREGWQALGHFLGMGPDVFRLQHAEDSRPPRHHPGAVGQGACRQGGLARRRARIDPACRARERAGHEPSRRSRQDQEQARGAEAADQDLLVVRRRVEQIHGGGRLRCRRLLVGFGRALQEGDEAAGRLRGPEGGCDRLVRRLDHRRQGAQPGWGGQVHRLHGEPGILRPLGHRRRRSGFGQRQGQCAICPPMP